MAKEHIQTFEKGMHLDNEPAFQPENSYRDCGHGRLLDHGEGNFSWTRLDGTEVQFSIEDGYTAVGYVEGDGETYIMYSNGTKHYIGMLENNSLTPVYITTKEKFFVLNSQVRGFIDYESREIVRMYWNDLITTPKTINLIDIKPRSGHHLGLVEGEKYLVTRGYYTQGEITYYPGDIFTYIWFSPGGYHVSDTVLVKYVDPDLLDFNPLKTEARIDFTELVDGNLPAAPYFIAYRYYTEGYKTSWSGLFGPYSMFTYEGSVDLDTPGRLWHARFNGATPARNTGKGLKLQITGIDTRYEKIEILAFKMIENGAFETGRIVVEEEISSSSLNVLITQYTGEQVSINAYTTATVAIERINDLFDIKKTLAIGGVTEEDQLDAGQRLNNPNDFKAITYEVPAFRGRIYDRNLNDLDTDTYSGLPSLKEDGTVRNGDILPGQYYKVLEGTVGYNGDTYTSGNVFLGKIDKPTWSDTGTVIPVFRICKYYDFQQEKNIFEYLDIRDQLGYKGIHSKRMAGYRSGETYRIGVLPVSKRGTFNYVRWIDDITIPERGSAESEQFETLNEDGNLVGPYITGYMKKYTETFRAADENKDYFNAQVASILVNVDLTDIIHDISGFYIVRCPVDKTILAEGPIANIIRRSYEEDDETIREWVKVHNILEPKEHLYEGMFDRFQWGVYDISEWMPPDYLLGTTEELRAEDEFEIAYKAIYQNDEVIEAGAENPVQKYKHIFYPTTARETTIDPSKISGIFQVENATEENELSTDPMSGSAELFRFHNIFKYTSPALATNGAAGGKCLVLTHSDNNDWWDPDANSLKQVPIVRHKRNKSVLYGGTTSSALANSQYMYVGHFQKVDEDFKEAIKTASYYSIKYIAKNIQLFGGDTYITMFTHARIIPFSIYKLVKDTMEGNVITLPLQTSVNPLARSGNSILGMKSPHIQLWNDDDNIHSDRRIENFEDFTVNNAWNSDPEILYPGAPIDINKSTKFKNRIRYSNTKIDGAKVDAYRQFMANNFVDVLGRYGSVNALHGFGSRLIFWQDKAIGFIPVDERALTNDPDKILVQLGVGGKFDRNDYVYENIGLEQRTSLVYVDGNWMWYDATRNKFLHMTRSLELSDESFVKGAESFFEDIGDYSGHNDPSGKGGIVGIFNRKKNLVYMTFIKAGSYNTIAYNIKLRSFVSKPQWGPSLYIPQENTLYGIAYNSQQVHKHDVESETAYGAAIEPYIEVIINPNLRDMKTFLGMLMRGGTNFFDEVTYKSVYDVVSSSYKNIAVDDVSELPENYQFVVDEWRFSVPEGNQGRMEGMYLYVKFVLKDMSKNIRMYQLVSNHNKLY